MGVVRFLLFNYPNTLEEVPFSFREGMTVQELAETLTAVEGVTAPADEMLLAGCMVDNRYVSEDYVFNGKEDTVDFMNQIGDG